MRTSALTKVVGGNRRQSINKNNLEKDETMDKQRLIMWHRI
jgi:hypothetical protein